MGAAVLRAACLLAALAAVLITAQAAAPPTTVGLAAWDLFPFHRLDSEPTDPRHAGIEGAEPALMDALCESAGLECQGVALRSLADRTALVANGTVDFVLATMSYTPERAEQVHFVRPFYWSAGVALFSSSPAGAALEKAIDEGRGIPAGTTLCGRKGYYALDRLRRDLPDVQFLLVDTVAEAAERVAAGWCDAHLDDSTSSTDAIGMPQLDVPVIYQEPYGVAIAKERAGSDLERRLTFALVQALQGGANSTLAQLEEQWVVANGVAANEKLPPTSLAVDFFSIDRDAPPAWLRQQLTAMPAGFERPL